MTEQTNLVPKRRFKEFQNTHAWKQRKLIEVASYRNGKAHEKDISDSGDFVVVNSKFVSTNGRIRKFANKQIEPLEKDEIAFVLSDVPNGKAIARTFLVRESNKYSLNQRIAGITSCDNTDSYFLSELMNRHHYFLKFDDGVGQTNLSKKDVEDFEEFYPAVEEQVKIGDFFEQLDNIIALHQRKLEKTKALKSAYLSEMFPSEGEREPKRRFAGFTQAWEHCKLGDIGQTFTGLSGKTKEDFGHGSAEYVTYMNVFSNPISDTSMVENVEVDSKQNELKYGDVLFTTSSETPQDVGMSSVWLGTMANVYLNSFCFGYRPTVKVNYLFFGYLLRSNTVRKQMMLLAQGISRYNISKNKVMELSVELPDIQEQEKIGTFFKQLDDTITFHQRKLKKLQNIKKAYQNEMFV